MMKFLTAVLQILTIGALLAFAGPVAAQDAYPSKPIRIIVPFPPGASNDILARILAQKFNETLGVQTIVDNRPGASTIIGAEALLKSSPDGYTIMITSATHIITPLLMKAPYDAVKDFAAIGTVDSSEYLLVVHPSLPVKTLQQFIALAKARPGQLNYASSSMGSANHIAMALLAIRTGITMQHVPYKGGGPAVNDLIGGQVQTFFNSPSSLVPHVKSGKIKAVAVTGEGHLPALPDVPTFTESGLPDFVVRSWHGLLAPLATPKAIINRLSAELGKILAMADTKDKLVKQGMAPWISTPEQFAALLRTDTDKFAQVIKTMRITAER